MLQIRLGEHGLEGTNSALTNFDFYADGMVIKYADDTVYDFTITKDGSGRITQVVNNTLNTLMRIRWHGGNKPV